METFPEMVWPFGGRDGDVAALVAAVADEECNGTIIVGPTGIGKSALARHVVSHGPGIADGGVIAANASIQTVPYGAMIPLFAPVVSDDEVVIDTALVMEAIDRRSAGQTGRVVVIVDDLPALDTASEALIMELLSGRYVHMIATARPDAGWPPESAAVEQRHGIRRMLLGPLDRPATERLLSDALGGPLETTAVGLLWDATAGNPLFLRELILDTLQRGALRQSAGGVWHLDGTPIGGDRLNDFVMERFHRLDPSLLALLQLIAITGWIHRSDLDEGHAAVDALVDAGLVSADGATEQALRLTHPFHAEMLRQSLGVFETRRLVNQASQLLESRSGRHGADALLIANWQLDVGMTPDPDVVIAGARRAHAAHDFASTTRLARAALGDTGSTEMRWKLVESLMHSGHSDEAERIAAAVGEDAWGNADADALSLLGARVYNLLWYRKDPSSARAVVERYRRGSSSGQVADELMIHEAYIRSFEGDATGSLELLDQGRAWHPTTKARGLMALAQALAIAGCGTAALEAADAAISACRGAPGSTGSVPPLLLVARARALTVVGHLGEAADTLLEALDDGPSRASGFVRAAVAIALGDVQLLRGRLGDARRWFGEAMLAASAATNPTLHAIAIGSLASAAGQMNDSVAAAALLADINEIELPSAIGCDELARGRAWATVAIGHPGGASNLLRREAGASHLRGEHWDALWMLIEAARLGAAAEVRYEVDALAGRMDGATPAAFAQFAQAMASRTVEALTIAEQGLVDVGADLMAAEAAGALAAAHRRDLDRRAADAATARARHHAALCVGADTPALASFDAVVPLSNRERQTAMLAARGLSNQEIASRLGLSPRTVGNHLQSAYTKLGITGRESLADRLAVVPLDLDRR